MTAFGLAIEAERRQLLRYAMHLCRNRDDAEDLVQETMYRALKAEHQFKAGTNLGGWLATIMRNERYDRSRRAKMLVDDATGLLTASLPSSEDQAAAYEARDALARLADLPAAFGRALVMMAEGLTVHDVAVREGVPDGTIKSRVHRGRAMLAGLIEGMP
jgi:RNA polymerase sigma-70 factor (ECF subfamily)